MSELKSELIGNDVTLGRVKDGHEKLIMNSKSRETHLYVVGATRVGKSKLLQSMIQQDILSWSETGCGMLLIDPHGSLYQNVMKYLAEKKHNTKLKDLPILPIDLRLDDWIISYNLLRQRENVSASVIVDGILDVVAHVWEAKGTAQTPLFAKMFSAILHGLYQKGLTLSDAPYFLTHLEQKFRKALAEGVTNPMIRNTLDYISDIKTATQMEEKIGSTGSRLMSFLSKELLNLMFGQKDVSINFEKMLNEGWIVLVNLSTTGGKISKKDARLFGTLLLDDLWETAKNRPEEDVKKSFYVYLDEFQEQITPTIAKSLDQSSKYGLRLILSHQYPNQLIHEGGDAGKYIKDSVMACARTKIAFSIEEDEGLTEITKILYRGTVDPDKVAYEIYSTKAMGSHEETRTIRGSNKTTPGSSETEVFNADGERVGGTF